MKKQTRFNPKKNRSARRARPISEQRKDLIRKTYHTTVWYTLDKKKRTKTELVPVVAETHTAPA